MRNYTDITILVDRSGSMQSIKGAMEEALKGYLDKIKQEIVGEAKVTAIEFDDKYVPLYGPVDLKDAPAITITPTGATALTGALGRVIKETGERLAAMPEHERPNQVIMVIITDGGENATDWVEWSKDIYTQQNVMEAVSRQREQYNWTFLYLGANQDAFAVSRGYGFASSNTLAYSSTPGSVRKMSDVLAKGVTNIANRSLSLKSTSAGTVNAFEAEEQDVREEGEKSTGAQAAANATTSARRSMKRAQMPTV
jgi:hypothetical protein